MKEDRTGKTTNAQNNEGTRSCTVRKPAYVPSAQSSFIVFSPVQELSIKPSGLHLSFGQACARHGKFSGTVMVDNIGDWRQLMSRHWAQEHLSPRKTPCLSPS